MRVTSVLNGVVSQPDYSRLLQLAALPALPLRDLDFQLITIIQIFCCDAKAAGCHLLNRARWIIPIFRDENEPDLLHLHLSQTCTNPS